MPGSAFRTARAQLAPAKPPPTTTMRGAAPWPIAGMASIAVAPAAATWRNSRRLFCMASHSADLFLRAIPGCNRLDLVVGESLGDPVHDGGRALPGPEGAHGARDLLGIAA